MHSCTLLISIGPIIVGVVDVCHVVGEDHRFIGCVVVRQHFSPTRHKIIAGLDNIRNGRIDDITIKQLIWSNKYADRSIKVDLGNIVDVIANVEDILSNCNGYNKALRNKRLLQNLVTNTTFAGIVDG